MSVPSSIEKANESLNRPEGFVVRSSLNVSKDPGRKSCRKKFHGLVSVRVTTEVKLPAAPPPLMGKPDGLPQPRN